MLSVTANAAEIESTRYPFCSYGKRGDPNGTRGIIDFLPFNSDLNRFRLVVSGASTGRLKVTWGKSSKIFSADELGRGINLAAEFLDNPFSEPFRVVISAVRRKQELETQGMRGAGQSAVRWLGPEQRSGVEKLLVGVLEKARALEAEVRAAVKPVIHTLKIERVP